MRSCVLDKDARSEIVKRMMSMAADSRRRDRASSRTSCATRLLADSATRDTSAGQTRVASVLNEMDKTQLDEVMQDLERSGAPDLERSGRGCSPSRTSCC